LIDVVIAVLLLAWRHGVMAEVPGVDGHQMGGGKRKVHDIETRGWCMIVLDQIGDEKGEEVL
jgi:hypothetical protein